MIRRCYQLHCHLVMPIIVLWTYKKELYIPDEQAATLMRPSAQYPLVIHRTKRGRTNISTLRRCSVGSWYLFDSSRLIQQQRQLNRKYWKLMSIEIFNNIYYIIIQLQTVYSTTITKDYVELHTLFYLFLYQQQNVLSFMPSNK